MRTVVWGRTETVARQWAREQLADEPIEAVGNRSLAKLRGRQVDALVVLAGADLSQLPGVVPVLRVLR